ncbi:hypothetical protein TRAPUB_2111 [Trametes pubescens]|uniref:DUF6589 domain-containing protein n=1 Tax=Trametes pubescens TaxID=154538 RepID=A0A1M2VHM0_TRAPU|nr:hypothetical protein TRAPUB_2111 [Trametes pubescens]
MPPTTSAVSANRRQVARLDRENCSPAELELIPEDIPLASSSPAPVYLPLDDCPNPRTPSPVPALNQAQPVVQFQDHLIGGPGTAVYIDNEKQSTPIRGHNKASRTASRKKKVAKHRRQAKEQRDAVRVQTQEDTTRVRLQLEQAQMEASQLEAEQTKLENIQDVLRFMEEKEVTYGEILLFLSDTHASKGYGPIRFSHFFADAEMVRAVLKNWTSSGNSRTGRAVVKDWAVKYVSDMLNREGNRVTKSGILQSTRRPVDQSFALNFNLQELHTELRQLCPCTTEILQALASRTVRRKRFDCLPDPAVATGTVALLKAKERRNKLVGSAMLTLLRSRSQKNSYVNHVLGLYLYATGAQRQVISVLSHLGLSSSYQTIAGVTNHAADSVTSVLRFLPLESDLEDSDYEPTPADLDLSSSDWEDYGEPSEDDLQEDMRRRTRYRSSSGDPTGSGDSGDSGASDSSQPAALRAVHVDSDPSTAPASLPNGQASIPRQSQRGLLRNLSDHSRKTLRSRAQAPAEDVDPLANVYDNINFMVRAAEQVLGRSDSQENGTCATAFALYGASRDQMRTADLVRSFNDAPPLLFKDICLTTEENTAFRERLISTVLQIIVQHGGDPFKKYKADLASASSPPSIAQIPVHKTEIFPMPAMHIDEASTVGNAEVLDAMFKELGHDLDSSEFADEVRVVFGDQLSMARVRAVTNTRIGHDDPAKAYLNVAFAPGFFHYQMAATQGILETHWGDPTLGVRDPASLSSHNGTLHRKPIVLSSVPPYRTCRDLVFVSLYGRVLHCLELVSSCSINEYPGKMDFKQLRTHAEEIIDNYADTSKIEAAASGEADGRADNSGAAEPDANEPPHGDPVFRNAMLFLRDSLILRHFADVIKSGTSDHLVTVLKLWALGFRAMGRVKYAHELLHLLHNLTHVWPAELRDIIMKNWLVNPTGHVNGFIPVDLLQEHFNFWIKTFTHRQIIYQAHGSNASWEWLEIIAPCIDTLRRLAAQVNAQLGSHQGDKHHAPDLTRDIHEIMRSLRAHGVYVPEHQRPGAEDVRPIPNVYTAGLRALPGPLADYNTTFRRMQARRAMVPVVGKSALDTYGIARPSATSLRPQAEHDDLDSNSEHSRSASPVSEWSASQSTGDEESLDEDAREGGMGPVQVETLPVEYEQDGFLALEQAEDVELDMDEY